MRHKMEDAFFFKRLTLQKTTTQGDPENDRVRHFSHKLRLLLSVPLTILFGTGCVSEKSAIKVDGKDKVFMDIDRSNTDLDIEDNGPYNVTVADYSFEIPGEDPMVLSGIETDVRGRIYMPNTSNPTPLLIFLHGNHATCGYKALGAGATAPYDCMDSYFTSYGQCTTLPGDTREDYGCHDNPNFEEIRSDKGYEYAAIHLASHGFVVASINANRGITGGILRPAGDSGLIIARGKLLLKHLYYLLDWSKNSNDPLSLVAPNATSTSVDPSLLHGKIDSSHIGFMGHSRGGEGVRAAYEIYTDQPTYPNTYAPQIDGIGGITIEAILELAPVDFNASSGVFNAEDASWAVVIGSCDEDVSNFQGTGTFRRRRITSGSAFSSVFVIPGANHNHFNTEWIRSDSEVCVGTQSPLWEKSTQGGNSNAQRDVGLLTISAFFRGFVGNFSSKDRFQQIFDPQYEVPKQISDLIDHSPRETVDENSGWEYLDMSHHRVSGVLDVIDLIEDVNTVIDYPNSERKLTKIEWDTSAGVSVSPYLDVVLSNRSGGGLGNLDNKILTFSVALSQFCDIDPTSKDVTHPTDINDFGIELLYDDGTTSTSDIDPAASGIQPPTLVYYDIMTDDSPNPMARCNPNFDGLTPLSCMNPGPSDSSLCLAALGSATTSKSYFAFNRCLATKETSGACPSGFGDIGFELFMSHHNPMPQGDCAEVDGSYYSAHLDPATGMPLDYGDCAVRDNTKLLLFSDVPLELDDDLQYDNTKNVSGLRFVFDQSEKGSIYLDNTFTVRPWND